MNALYSCVITNDQMKYINYILISLVILSSCASGEVSSEQQPFIKTEKKSTFNSCFETPDSSHKQLVVGCSNTFYKLIGSKYVLSISTDTIIENGFCVQLTNDINTNSFVANLQVYDSDLVSLPSICSDIILINQWNPIKLKTLTNCTGQLTIGKSDPSEINGSTDLLTSILVKHLIFT
ncbi:MAG: hypothetical protein ACI9N1_000242, partial [Flavobacteriales bacterium]